MSKSVRKLLAALLCVSATYVSAGTTNKTYLMPRDPATDLAMDFTTFHKTRNAHYNDKDHFGGRFFATGYYKASTNEGSIGKYFGFEDDNCKDHDFIGVAAEDPDGFRLFPQDILHDQANAGDPGVAALNPLQDDIRFRPCQETWGLTLGYHQLLDCLWEGLYFFVKLPIAHVSHDMNAKSKGPNISQNTEGGAGSPVTVFDILSGNVTQSNDPNKQEALKYAKLDCDDNDETELAGINITLGYNIFYEPHAHFGVSSSILIPTGDSPDAEYLWGAVASNGGHWEWGFTLDGHYEWKLGDHTHASVHSAFNFMYVFEDSEWRTLGFKRRNGNFVDWGHYVVGGMTGSNILFPLANVLTRKVEVEPGGKIDTYLAASLTHCDWTFDLGYEFFWKDREDIDLKCGKHNKHDWVDGMYGIAQFSYDTGGAPFDATDPADAFQELGFQGDASILRTDLDVSVAETSSYITHKLFGGIGYTFTEWDNPMLFGIGAHYEFADDRSALETWAIWLKLGIAV